MKKIYFGLGCFNFLVNTKIPFTFNGQEYITQLTKRLENIANISNVDIYTDDDFKNWTLEIKDQLPSIESYTGIFPKANFFVLDFDIYIPKKLQCELTDRDSDYLDTFTEKFHINIHHTFHYPVTAVIPINPTKSCNPSTAVRIIREFLKKEFNKENENIGFECLGPSPFHADLALSFNNTKIKLENSSNSFSCEHIPNRGYDIINFYSKSKSNEMEIMNDLLFTLSNEVGFFYFIINEKNSLRNDWDKIQNDVDDLLLLQSEGIKNKFKKVFYQSKIIKKIQIAIAQFNSTILFSDEFSNKSYQDIYTTSIDCYLQFFIDKEIKQKKLFPINETIQLVNFFESRRVKSVELLFLILSAIFGGAIGALLSKLFTSVK